MKIENLFVDEGKTRYREFDEYYRQFPNSSLTPFYNSVGRVYENGIAMYKGVEVDPKPSVKTPLPAKKLNSLLREFISQIEEFERKVKEKKFKCEGDVDLCISGLHTWMSSDGIIISSSAAIVIDYYCREEKAELLNKLSKIHPFESLPTSCVKGGDNILVLKIN